MKRRELIKSLASGSLLAMLPTRVFPTVFNDEITFGIVSDVHKDLMPDAEERLQKFIDTARERELDFIIQLGDFCFGNKENLPFMSIWNEFKGPRYHVLGNHDMDRNSKAEIMRFWEMPKPYYSFDYNSIHFVVLDANHLYAGGKYLDYEHANFYVPDSMRTYVNPEQIEWLRADLAMSNRPTIVFSHQSLWHYQNGIKNRLEIQKILEEQKSTIICCINGHNHIDFQHQLNGINYLDINSMSYQWMADDYTSKEHFAPELYAQYPNLHHIAPYKDPLFAIATLRTNGSLMIEGVKSDWVSPSPEDLGMPIGPLGNQYSAEISNYLINNQ